MADNQVKDGRAGTGDGQRGRGSRDGEAGLGGVGPANWWRMGLVVLGAMALVLLVMQLMNGGARTDVVPGTPVTPAAPVTQPAQ